MARSVDQANDLTQDDGDAPGSEQSVEGTLIEPPYDCDLDEHSDGANYDRRQYNTPPGRCSSHADAGNHIGAEHKQLAMGKIDDAEHAEDNRQAE